jgi:cyclophilin family peptidyl-prolyl cis-trans isomerase/HEAT repeat protein
MAERHVPRRRLLLAIRPLPPLLFLLLAGCAGMPMPAAVESTRPPPTEAELEVLARLLRLEDRRESDGALLATAARSGSPTVRRAAMTTIARLRSTAFAPLLAEALADPDTAVVATAALALGQVRDTLAVPRLATMLTVPRALVAPTVAAEAATALGALGTAAARPALEAYLREADPRDPRLVQPSAAALLAIWRFPVPDDLGPILRWAEVPDPELRWRAVYALVRRPTPAAVPLLQRLTRDPHPLVRSLAVRGLTAPLAEASGVEPALLLPALLAALQDVDYGVRINAARSLATFPAPEAVRALVAASASGDPHLALAAVEGLGRAGVEEPAAVARLRALAEDAGAPLAIRQAALEALPRVAAPEGAEVAARMATSTDWRLRASAARALAALGPPLRPESRILLRDPDGRVVRAGLEALADRRGPALQELRTHLIESLGAGEPRVRALALDALGRLQDPTLLPLLLDAYGRAERDAQPDAALAALRALAELRTPGADPARALFARFRRPADHLVHRQAVRSFGDAALRAWGEPGPVAVDRDVAEYRALLRAAPPASGASGRLPRLRVETEAGVLELLLFADAAPLTVENILRLARAGYFDGQEWPRVVPNFVVQGGDPRGDTSGGPGYTIRDEINRQRYHAGTVGMALAGPDTGGSQFFMTHAPQPHLDGDYTVFGTVVSGAEVLTRILPGEIIYRIREVTSE